MNVDYKDIIERAGAPGWWGRGGVPRYGAFDPDALDIYATEAVLYEVECQRCGCRFKVADWWSSADVAMALMTGHEPRSLRRARSGVIGHEVQRKASPCPECGVRLDGATCVKCGATWPGYGEGTA